MMHTMLNYVTIVISVITLVALCFLFGFHVFLMQHKMSTLQYIKRKENKDMSSKVVTRVVDMP